MNHAFKIFNSELQLGLKWNPHTMDWHTNEDFIDTKRRMNDRLVKISAGKLAANIPQQFKRLNLCNLDDCKMLTATCDKPEIQ